MKLWSLNIPSKLRIFLWRACQGILPTKEARWKRNITSDKLCPIYKTRMKSVFYVLISCQEAKKMWETLSWGKNLFGKRERDFGAALQNWADSVAVGNVEDLTYLLWSVWFTRNGFVYNNRIANAVGTRDRANRMCNSYTHQRATSSTVTSKSPFAGWNPLLSDAISSMSTHI